MTVGDLIIPSGYGNAVMHWQVTGRTNPVSCGLGYKPLSSIDPTEHAEAIFVALIASGSLCAAADMLEVFTFTDVTVTYNDAGVMLGGISTHAPVVGTASSTDGMVISSTLLIQKRTGLIGKFARGRMYWPLMSASEGAVDMLGNITTTLHTFTQAQTDTFVDGLGSGSPVIDPYLLHHEPATGVAPLPIPISAFNVSTKVATQRRRLR